MRQLIFSLTLVFFVSNLSQLCAQGPRGRALLMGPPIGPSFGPALGMRPPMPPIPVPTVRIPQPSYIRIPGTPLPATPRYVVPTPPTLGYYRSSAVVAIPVPVPYTAARIAVVESTQASSPSVYSIGNSAYRTAPTNPAVGPAVNSNSSDLRPGMVLPDGSVVVSVGQPGIPSATGQSPTQAAATPHAPPVPSPIGNADEPRSILENAEEIPRPQSAGETEKPPTRQF